MVERDCNALGGLFQIIINDMKVRLGSLFRSSIAVMAMMEGVLSLLFKAICT